MDTPTVGVTIPKVGVFICRCGGNISSAIDLDRLRETCEATGAVVGCCDYLCSGEGQALIVDAIKTKGIQRAVIAACSPVTHEKTFKECIASAGINPYLLDIANIREQCAWLYEEGATEAAIEILASSISACRAKVPLEDIEVPVVKSVVVAGGGIAGMTAALSLAKQGIKAYIIERSPTLGGNMSRVGKVFSPDRLAEDCALCSLAPLMGEVAKNKDIEILPLSKIVGIKGHPGDFCVTVERAPIYIDPGACTSCGKCNIECPTMVKDEWNAGLGTRKAAHRPFAQAVPGCFTIDPAACLKCGRCQEVCPSGAIDLSREKETIQIRAGAVIVATGFKEHDPSGKSELGYGRLKGVMTQMELARVLAVNGPTCGKLVTPLTGKQPRRVVMVQCVGSRDEKPGSMPICSKVCCMTALKHAKYIREHFPETDTIICYTDMRAPGTYESYYRESQKKGVRLIRGRVGEVLEKDGKLLVRTEDTLGGGPMAIESDMVVLSCAMEPSEGTADVAKALGISLTPELFVKEKHPKLEPASTASRGIFVCGAAAGPRDITESILSARAAASRASEMLSPGKALVEPRFAVIDPSRCIGCGKCIELCPYEAPYRNGTIKIDPLSCIGLGGCIARCPEGAITLPSCGDEELTARISALTMSGKPVVLAFLDETIAYSAMDSAGMNKAVIPADVRLIKVPSVMRLELKHLLYAFERGAAGIFLADGTVNSSSGAVRANVSKRYLELKKGLAENGIDTSRLSYYEAYLPHYRGLASRLSDFSRLASLKNAAASKAPPQAQKKAEQLP